MKTSAGRSAAFSKAGGNAHEIGDNYISGERFETKSAQIVHAGLSRRFRKDELNEEIGIPRNVQSWTE
jgi:hypothetical protein